jgi:hypothetical protein
VNERRQAAERHLPLKAVYTVGTLARAGSMDRRVLVKILEDNEVRFVRSGRFWFVSITELERKLPPLWEGIKAVAEMKQFAWDP